MKQEQVDAIPSVPYAKALLAGDEREFASELQKEFLQMLDESVLQFTLRVFVLRVQKFANEGVTDVVIGETRRRASTSRRECAAAFDRS